MISSFVKKLFLILPLIGSSNQSKDTCNGSCLTKTFAVEDSASVTFAAKQIDGTTYLTIILIGYNIKETENQRIAVSIVSNSNANIYACERNSSGYIISYFARKTVQFRIGSYFFQDNTLYCFWTMSKATSIWPKKSDGSVIDLEIDSGYRVILVYSDISFLVATSTEDLPIYQMKFLKCCNMVYGNDQVQLFARQTDNSNDFTLQLLNTSSHTPDAVEVQLTGSDDSQIMFEWYIPGKSLLYGLLKIGLCSWSIPIVIRGFSQDYDTRERVYGLTIYLDGKLVYKRSDISLISFASTKTPSLFFVLTVFLFHQFLQ